MKKLTPFLIGCFLIFGAVACQDTSRTSQEAPENVNTSPETPNAKTTEASQQDAQSNVRRRQLDSNIRAREQRSNVTGGDTDRAVKDLESEVSSKLEANIPNGLLTVNAAENGTVTVAGTVNNKDQLAKIEPLAKEIKGVKNVVVKAIVAPPKN